MLLRIGNSAAKRFFSTIYAHSSGQGKSGVAVIRVSGPKSIDVLKRLTGLKKVPLPRTAILRKFSNPTTGCTIDKGLVLFFPAPKSFTGDDVVEFHIHGGKAVVAAMLSAIGQVQNCFPAEPGDFTRRAFLAGKMDLTEVEGLADLLSAETEAQRQQALLQMEGHLGQLYKKWAEQLARCMAHVEAFIDFSEDDNIEDGVLEAVDKQVKNLMKEIQGHLSDGRRGEILRSGVSVSIVGEPNVGKSSILNTLAHRPAAIVTSQAGTTRDVVQVSLDLGGYPVQLSDTAGLREANDEVEKEGIRRARVSAEKADLVLLVASAPEIYRDSLQNMGFDDSIKKYLRKCDLEINPKNCIIILNKNDLLENDPSDFTTDLNVVHTSCESREGMNQLLKVLQEKLSLLCGEPSKECPTITQARHRAHIENCSNYLQKFLLCMEENHDLVIAAEQLRQALRNLGLLTGKVSTEQLLDLVFSEFCIGK